MPDAARAFQSIDQSTAGERAAQVRLNLGSDRVVGVADPGDVGRDIERRRKRPAALVRDRHAEFARDQLGAEIVWVTTERSATHAPTLEQRPQVGDEPIVSREQLVELSAARNVLILE